MSNVVAVPVKSTYALKRAAKVERSVKSLAPLNVEIPGDVYVSGQVRQGISRAHYRDVIPVAGMFMGTVPVTPVLSYAVAPELYYTVPGMAGMAVITLGWMVMLGAELSRNINRTEKAIMKRYAPEIKAWLKSYGTFNVEDVETITNIILYDTLSFSGACFICDEGYEFMLIWDREKRSWFMEELAETVEQDSVTSGVIKSLTSYAPDINSAGAEEVFRKINMLENQKLSVEESHVVNRVNVDMLETLLAAEELKQLGDTDYIDHVESTAKLLKAELDSIITDRKNEIREMIASLKIKSKEVS